MESQLFAGLPPERVHEVLAQARHRTFRRGDIVFHEEDPGDSLHLIVRGHFAIRVTTPLGQMSTMRLFGPGDLFGRIALPTIGAIRAATMTALNGGETYEFYRQQLDGLRAAHPSVNDALLASLGQHLQWVSEQLLEVLFVDADRRVRRQLLGLCRLYREGDSDGGVEIPLTQEDIAGLAGTSRATVNRVLGEEERRGTLRRQRGRILLLDPDDLARRAD